MGMDGLFSERSQEKPDVFTYTDLPQVLRGQIAWCLKRLCIYDTRYVWQGVHDAVAEAQGLASLYKGAAPIMPALFATTDWEGICLGFLERATLPQAIDLLEAAYREVDSRVPNPPDVGAAGQYHRQQRVRLTETFGRINARFRQHGVGFRFEGGTAHTMASEVLHEGVTRSTLALLHRPEFAGPNSEFLRALSLLREGRHESATIEAAKAFESTMKVICDAHGWRYDRGATAKHLIAAVLSNGLVPSYSQEQLGSLDKCLLGVATIRNKDGAHGTGSTIKDVPAHLAEYAIYLAGANIRFLVECHLARDKPSP